MSLKEEIIKIKTDSEKTAISKSKELLKVYKRNLNDIQQQINNIYAKYTVDGQLNISSRQRYAVLKQLEKQMTVQIKELGEKGIEITANTLSDVFEDTYYRTAFTIDKGISGVASFAVLKPEMVKAAVETPIKGEMFSKRIWKNQDLLAKRVIRDTEKAIIQGQSVEKLARQIKKDYGSSAYEAKRLISNETARVMGHAQDEAMQNSGVVDTVMFDATLDDKTSDICQSLDGKEYPLDDHPIIPEDTHVGCRSAIIPKIKNWSPTKKIENIKDPSTGKKTVIDYSSYDNWKISRGIE